MSKHIGILTAGGDSPGLNAAIRAIGKSALRTGKIRIVGFRDGFRGLMENRTMRLDWDVLASILTQGGTILGTSRDKPHKMQVGSEIMDMTEVICENYHRHNLDALICIGGGGTQKNAYRLAKAGLNILTLPKTIDNDVGDSEFKLIDHTPGYGSVARYWALNVQNANEENKGSSPADPVLVMQAMGRKIGFIPAAARLADPGREIARDLTGEIAAEAPADQRYRCLVAPPVQVFFELIKKAEHVAVVGALGPAFHPVSQEPEVAAQGCR